MARKKEEINPPEEDGPSLAEIKKKYGMVYASDIKHEPKRRTGIFALDYVLDGGISMAEGGHRIEFYGKESSFKTSFTLKLIELFQKNKEKCAYVDVEESFDAEWASRLGVNTKELLVARPDYLEQAGDMLVEMIPNFGLIVTDSIPSLIPKAELEGSLEDRNMALQAQLNSPLTRKLYSACKGKFTTMIFINQLREKVGGYGNPIVTPGGRALKHFYNTRIEFKPTEFIETGTKDEKERIGVTVALTCTKNKKGKPHRTAVVDFYYDGFVDNRKSLLYSGIKYGIIQQSGGWYIYKDQKIQGEKKFCSEVDEKDWKIIENEIWERIK